TLLNPAGMLEARKHLDLTGFELDRLTGLLSGYGLASDGGELAADVTGLVPVRDPERFVELFPGAKGRVVLWEQTVDCTTSEVIRVDCPGDQLGFSRKAMPPVPGPQWAGFRRISIGRRPGVSQFESKRLSSITA